MPALAFTADRAEFATAVGKVVTFVQTKPKRGTRAYWAGPVLRGILLVCSADAVEITGSDLERTGREVIAASTVGHGPALVDAARLAGICRHLAGDTVSVELRGSVLHVSGGAARFRLLTMPDWDYPTELPQPSPMARVRPAKVDDRTSGQKLLADMRRGFTYTTSREAYAPTDLQPGAWITWVRKADGESVEVSGQVWDTARGTRAVWAIAEGEQRAVRVEERTYGRGSYSTGGYERYKQLEEVSCEVPALAACEARVISQRGLVA